MYDWCSLQRHKAETWTVSYCLNRAIGQQDTGMKGIKDRTRETEGWKYSRNDSLLSFSILFHHLDVNTWLLIPLSIQHNTALAAVKWLGAVRSQTPFLSLIQAVFYLGPRGSSYVSFFRSTSLLLSVANKLENSWTFHLKKYMQCSSHSRHFCIA